MTTLHLRKSIGRSPLRLGFLLIPLVLACFALSPTARAVIATDGGYPERQHVLRRVCALKHHHGFNNTAIGAGALYSNTTGFATRPLVLMRSTATQRLAEHSHRY